MTKSHAALLKRLSILFTLSTLIGCAGEAHGDFAPICPHVDVLSDAADLYQFRDKQQDLSALNYHVTIDGVLGNCAAAPGNAVRSRVSLRLTVRRGASNAPLEVDLPYFIAVTRDDRVLDKKTFVAHLTVPQNAGQTTMEAPLRFIDVPASPDLQDTNYGLKIGLQLSPEQLAYNRAHLVSGNFRKTDD